MDTAPQPKAQTLLRGSLEDNPNPLAKLIATIQLDLGAATDALPVRRYAKQASVWASVLSSVPTMCARAGTTERALDPAEAVRAIEATCRPVLDQTAIQVLTAAHKEGMVEAANQVIKEVEASLFTLGRSASPPISLLALQSSASQFLAARQDVERALHELQRLSGVWEGPSASGERSLSEGELQVWKLLAGRSMDAKAIARQLGTGATEAAVRKAIMKIKRKGLPIEHDRRSGYTRPDAPPPSE